MLIPQTFYSTRGTPLSAYHRARHIIKLGHEIDILTYPIGDRPPELNSKVYRSVGPHFARHIKQGPSYLKIWFDCIFFLNLIYRLLRKRYDLIYTHEEAGFMYAFLLSIFRTPFVYDMHSSLPLQVQEWNFSQHKFVINLFSWVERFTLVRSAAAIAISPGVAKAAKKASPDTKVITILNSFEIQNSPSIKDVNRIRAELGIGSEQKIVLYTGSFVALQALDLLIKSIPTVINKLPDTKFVLVGGRPEEIIQLKRLADQLDVAKHLMLLAARPQEAMPSFMAASDVLVSPRVIGINPPGKLLSYLDSGKPVVLTDCYVHNQLVNDSIAILTEPDPVSLSHGIIKALIDDEYVHQIVKRAKDFVNAEFRENSITERYNDLFKHIDSFDG
jgi:glycosyltransferase involved in cell wall biosynthesis